MVEALIALRAGGDLVLREKGVEVYGSQHRADHFALCVAGVDAPAVEHQLCGGGVEVFIFDLAQRTAVHGVGVVRAEALDIEEVRAAADLLVWRKADADDAVRLVGAQQQLRRGENFRHARLIVRAEQRGAVRDDEVLAGVAEQRREVLRRKDDALFLVQDDVSARINVGDAGLDILAAGVGRGVHMCDQAQHRQLFLAVCGDGAVDIAVLVHLRVGNAKLLHLAHKLRTKNLLIRGGGADFGIFIGGRFIRHKLQKTVNDSHILAPLLIIPAL